MHERTIYYKGGYTVSLGSGEEKTVPGMTAEHTIEINDSN